MESILKNLEAVSIQPPYQYNSEDRSAAVLVVLCEVEGVCHVLLNKRSETLRRHPGQVCFPGGMRDPEDESAVDTALRECEEEIGLPRDVVMVTSVLPSLNYKFTPNPAEVADIFHLPLSSFLSSHQPPLLSHTVDHISPSFDLHHFNVEFGGREFDVQGITAHLCVFVAAIGLGRRPEFEYTLPTDYCVVSEGIRACVDGLS